MRSQLHNLAFWVGGILLVVLVTVFYQPVAAKTGSLLVWQAGQIAILDIDTLAQTSLGPAEAEALISPSPGCLGQGQAPCWVAAGPKLYRLGQADPPEITLPLEIGERWLNLPVSWSPDGLHLAYAVLPAGQPQAALKIYNVATRAVKTGTFEVDPQVGVAWAAGCRAGLEAEKCRLGYKTTLANSALTQKVVPAWAAAWSAENSGQDGSQLVSLTLATGEQQNWFIPEKSVSELRFAADSTLLYSQPPHYFHRVQDHSPAYHISPGSQLANMSPEGRYTVYYEPFTQKECQAERPKGGCWYLGVWLSDSEQRHLLYSRELSQAGAGLLNTDPFWSPRGDAFMLFREGSLIYYSLKYRKVATWFKGVSGQLTSSPVFSPNQTAVALVTQQNQTSAEYHLLVLNPEFKPLEQVIVAPQGFRLLAWLPHQLP